VEKKKKLLVLLMAMLDEDMCEYVDRNGEHSRGYREDKKKVLIELPLKSSILFRS